MSLILDGSNGVTFPNGSNPQAAPSKVLQVVSANFTNQQSTTSTSFVASQYTLSITPLFSTSKIYIVFNGCGAVASGYAGYTIYRGSTNLCVPIIGLGIVGSTADTPLTIAYLDSPATTSSTTYTIYWRSSAGQTVYIGEGSVQGSITLMEIAQ